MSAMKWVFAALAAVVALMVASLGDPLIAEAPPPERSSVWAIQVRSAYYEAVVSEVPDREASDRSGWARDRGAEVRATYYHPSLAGGLMADNATEYWRDQSGLVAVSIYGPWKLGDVLYVCGPSGRCLWLEARDTGLMPWGDIDLSEADFLVLAGSLDMGRMNVNISREA